MSKWTCTKLYRQPREFWSCLYDVKFASGKKMVVLVSGYTFIENWMIEIV